MLTVSMAISSFVRLGIRELSAALRMRRCCITAQGVIGTDWAGGNLSLPFSDAASLVSTC